MQRQAGHLRVNTLEELKTAEDYAKFDQSLNGVHLAAGDPAPLRIALGPRAGQKVLSMQSVPSLDAQDMQQHCLNQQGFSLHAAVR